jgi:hypothetical protein
MNDWINLTALWQILVVGLICGAGLPALFAIGLRFISPRGEDEIVLSGDTATVSTTREFAPGAAMIVAGSLCFAVVLAAIGWGIYIIVNGA